MGTVIQEWLTGAPVKPMRGTSPLILCRVSVMASPTYDSLETAPSSVSLPMSAGTWSGVGNTGPCKMWHILLYFRVFYKMLDLTTEHFLKSTLVDIQNKYNKIHILYYSKRKNMKKSLPHQDAFLQSFPTPGVWQECRWIWWRHPNACISWEAAGWPHTQVLGFGRRWRSHV